MRNREDLDEEISKVMSTLANRMVEENMYFPKVLSLFTELSIKTSKISDYILDNNFSRNEELNKKIVYITEDYINKIDLIYNELKGEK